MDIEHCKMEIHSKFPHLIIDDIHNDTESGKYTFLVSGATCEVTDFASLGKCYTTRLDENQLSIVFDPNMKEENENFWIYLAFTGIMVLFFIFVYLNYSSYNEIVVEILNSL